MITKTNKLKKIADKGIDILYRGKKYNTEKDSEELAKIYNSGLSAKQDLIVSLGFGLMIAENKDLSIRQDDKPKDKVVVKGIKKTRKTK